MMKTDKVFANCSPRLSEVPVHFRRDNMLYWRGLDGEVFRKKYDTDVDDYEIFNIGIGNIGCILEQEDWLLLFGDNGGVYKWLPYEESILLKRYPVGLFNDCFADCKGRIYCGVLADNYFDSDKRGDSCLLVRIDLDAELTVVEKLYKTTPNGIAFSPENDKMYFAVTDADSVFVYDYDADSGEVCNKRIFASNCCPDGIAVDSNGNVWVTDCRVGGPLICYSPDGKVIEKYYFPIRRVTSVGFGGENMNTLFITTAHENEPVGEFDGGVFMIENTATAKPKYFVKVKW